MRWATELLAYKTGEDLLKSVHVELLSNWSFQRREISGRSFGNSVPSFESSHTLAYGRGLQCTNDGHGVLIESVKFEEEIT